MQSCEPTGCGVAKGAEFWNKIAKEYAQRPVEDPAAFERKIAFIKDLMTPDSIVLDVGCGTGSLALRLAQSGCEIHGVDFSEEMIRIARQKRDAAQAHNVVFHVGAFDDTFNAFEPGSLDGVGFHSLLHLVPQRKPILERAFSLLKPGGFLTSSTSCLGEARIPFGPMLTVMRWIGKAPPVTILRSKALLEEFQAAGFEDARIVDVGAKPTIAFIVAHKPG